jgi:hypothetical protein
MAKAKTYEILALSPRAIFLSSLTNDILAHNAQELKNDVAIMIRGHLGLLKSWETVTYSREDVELQRRNCLIEINR